jgi:hypothetical protein
MAVVRDHDRVADGEAGLAQPAAGLWTGGITTAWIFFDTSRI